MLRPVLLRFTEKYQVHEVLGAGAFSKVYRCAHLSTGSEYAAKIIDLRPLRVRGSFDAARLRREIEILQKVKRAVLTTKLSYTGLLMLFVILLILL